MIKKDGALTPEEMILIQHLMAGKSITQAANAMGIGDKTARRWLVKPHVAQAYEEQRQNIALHVRKQIEQLSTTAITALTDSLAGKGMVKFLSAKYVIDHLAGDPARTAVQPLDSQHVIDAVLMQYMTDEEIALIESIMERARVRKAEAEEKITPIRREA